MNLVSVYGWKTEDDFYVDDCSQTEKHIDTLSMEGDWKRDVKNVVKRNASKYYHIEVSDEKGNLIDLENLVAPLGIVATFLKLKCWGMMNKASIQFWLRLSIKSALIAALTMIAAIVMSYWAEPFKQSIGIGTSMLGANRDFLVNGREWFFCGLGICILMTFNSFMRLHKLSK